ncbi:hypothetical protein [Kitasatospora sp. NBC_01266]|uniref:hypothetical protein n=1 Tax=Kitasatospora sp. NBC_01266 TaxID=2903572 RepID=UPI002E2EAC56|nr:hypothetical protein [Kitasatospora sp. NBC_01266]
MSTQIRRATGTRTAIDVLLSALRIRRRTTQQDLADLAAGSTLQVTCFSSTLGTVRTVPIGKGRTIPQTAMGYLFLTAGQTTWQNRRTKETVTLRSPFSLAPAEKRAASRKMARLDLLADGRPHEIVIPKADVALVTQVWEQQHGN